MAETVETLDSMNRIWVMTNRRSDAMGAPVFSSHTYTFDTANRRDLAVREDGTRWDYDYNDRSEVTAAKRQLGNGTLLAGMESTYVYDAIGNRTSSSSGGGPAVASNGTDDIKRSVSYESNALNQYTKMTQGARSFDVAGRYVYDPAASGSSPQVNGITPWEQTISSGAGGTQLKHFRTSLTAAASGNTTGNYENVNVSTAAGTVLEYSGLKWVPKTIVQPTYDFDGNLLTDGRWTYTWDAEPRRLAGAETERALARPRRGEGAERRRLNQYRLKSMSHSGSVTPYVPGLLVEFRYDGLSRRVEKKVSTFNGSIWIEQLRERTLYYGWNPIGTWRLQPPDAGHSNPWWKLHQHYVWGPDVSGTEQGAGGVGGLAMIIGGSSGNWFPCYDGNGNITALVDAQPNGALAAQYDYDAFGNPVRMSGGAVRLNPFRFSTKFTDDETELVYYGYRYYSPGMGRWVNRDPIGERGGLNIAGFLSNNGVKSIDILGLTDDHALMNHEHRLPKESKDSFYARRDRRLMPQKEMTLPQKNHSKNCGGCKVEAVVHDLYAGAWKPDEKHQSAGLYGRFGFWLQGKGDALKCNGGLKILQFIKDTPRSLTSWKDLSEFGAFMEAANIGIRNLVTADTGWRIDTDYGKNPISPYAMNLDGLSTSGDQFVDTPASYKILTGKLLRTCLYCETTNQVIACMEWGFVVEGEGLDARARLNPAPVLKCGSEFKDDLNPAVNKWNAFPSFESIKDGVDWAPKWGVLKMGWIGLPQLQRND